MLSGWRSALFFSVLSTKLTVKMSKPRKYFWNLYFNNEWKVGSIITMINPAFDHTRKAPYNMDDCNKLYLLFRKEVQPDWLAVEPADRHGKLQEFTSSIKSKLND